MVREEGFEPSCTNYQNNALFIRQLGYSRTNISEYCDALSNQRNLIISFLEISKRQSAYSNPNLGVAVTFCFHLHIVENFSKKLEKQFVESNHFPQPSLGTAFIVFPLRSERLLKRYFHHSQQYII